MSQDLSFRPFADADEEAVISLWDRCGLTRPWNDPNKDIRLAREKPASDILVGELDGEIVASVMVGHDGHRGALYYVSVDPDHQGKGYGRQVMRHAEDWLKGEGIWKLNLLLRADNEKIRAFYETLGYEVEPRLCMARRLLD